MKQTVKFPFSNNRGQTLAGLLDLPEGAPLFYGVFAPCFTCTKESHGAHKISRALQARGVAMLRFDITGLGESEGAFADTNFSTRVGDIIAACNALAAAHEAPKLLIGHSISGTAAIAAAQEIPGLQAVATLGAPSYPSHVVDGLRKQNLITEHDGLVDMMIAGRKITVKKQMMEDMQAYSMKEAIMSFDRKLFIFHAPHDDIAAFRNAQIIYDDIRGDRELIPLSESATHLFEQGNEEAEFVAETICRWFSLHLQA